jgi:hypothetical protein
MDVGVLLETRRSGEGLPALLASVGSGTDVMAPDVPLKIGRV